MYCALALHQNLIELNNNKCIIIILNYITQKRNIIKIIKEKFKIMLNDKICIELYYYTLFISFSWNNLLKLTLISQLIAHF